MDHFNESVTSNYYLPNNDENKINNIDMLNIEQLSIVDDEVPFKWSTDDLLTDSIIDVKESAENPYWEDDFADHYYPNEESSSDAGFSFDRWID